MKRFGVTAFLFASLSCAAFAAQDSSPAQNPPGTNVDVKPYVLPNPHIDMQGFLKDAIAASNLRESHRLSEDDFIRMSKEQGTVVLDARSSEKYNLLHIKGAINLSFPDITIESLHRVLPDKSTRILIYCNNNFVNNEKAFPSKNITASLNLSTYVSLYSYGYRNVYELGPLVDVHQTKLELVSTNSN